MAYISNPSNNPPAYNTPVTKAEHTIEAPSLYTQASYSGIENNSSIFIPL